MSMEEMYKHVSFGGKHEPYMMVNQFGAWIKQKDGTTKVYGIGEDCDLYELSEEEQARRIKAMGEWLDDIKAKRQA